MPKGKKSRKNNRRRMENHTTVLDVFQERIYEYMNTYNLDEITAENTSDGLEVFYSEHTDNCIVESNIELPALFDLLQSSMPRLNIKELNCMRYGNIFDFEFYFATEQIPYNVFADVTTAAENKKTLCPSYQLPQSV